MGDTTVAKKPISFKDLMIVDYTPEMPEQISWNAQKRRRGVVGEGVTTEALNFSQRRVRAMIAKRNKSKLAMGRRRSALRTADSARFMKRARRLAINLMFKKMSKGVAREDLPLARRQEIEARLEKMKGRIEKLARRLLPKVRELEKQRKQGTSASDKKAEQE